MNSFYIPLFYSFTVTVFKLFLLLFTEKIMLAHNAITYLVFTMIKQRNPTEIVTQQSNQIHTYLCKNFPRDSVILF